MIFAIFQEVQLSKNTKKVQLLNFVRLPASQFSLDLKKNRIWAIFTYIYNIS